MATATETTILIAEDNADDTFFIRRALAKTGLPLQACFVPNGQAAIDYLQGSPPYQNRETFPLPKALMLDLKMPMVDGFEVLAWLKSQPALKHLPAVIHSTSPLDSDKKRAQLLGASAFYVKDSDSATMIAMFKEFATRWLDCPLPPV